MKKVEAASAAQQAQRGPANASMQHFHEPQPVVARNGEKRWEFKCKHCGRCVLREKTLVIFLNVTSLLAFGPLNIRLMGQTSPSIANLYSPNSTILLLMFQSA